MPSCVRFVRGTTGRIALVLVFVILAAACVPPKKPPPPPPDTYVALGDSFSAGTLIPNQIPPLGCLKSDHNFPHLFAPSSGMPKFVDVSCSGAKTDHMTQAQPFPTGGGTNPPQFDALDSMTGIVTITIGGNDVGYWSTITDACTSTIGVGTPCQDLFVVNGVDHVSQLIADAAPKVGAVLEGIHQRAPRARVYIVAYEAIFPEAPLTPGGPEGCHPQLQFAPGDVPYLRAKQQELNAMIEQQGVAHNATFVDAYAASVGRDACRLPAVRWVEPSIGVVGGFKLHPNQAGMVGAKDALIAAL
jgi:lysophospholipase L1-like esterase